jgi:hypothetical protein
MDNPICLLWILSKMYQGEYQTNSTGRKRSSSFDSFDSLSTISGAISIISFLPWSTAWIKCTATHTPQGRIEDFEIGGTWSENIAWGHSDESQTTAAALQILCYDRRWRHETKIWCTEYGLIILSHIVLAKFAITSKRNILIVFALMMDTIQAEFAVFESIVRPGCRT